MLLRLMCSQCAIQLICFFREKFIVYSVFSSCLIGLMCRHVTSLGHRGGEEFSEGVQSFSTTSNTFNYAQHIFQRGSHPQLRACCCAVNVFMGYVLTVTLCLPLFMSMS